jgi:hypothetical protein
MLRRADAGQPASQADARERSARRRPSVRSRVSWPPLTVIWMS